MISSSRRSLRSSAFLLDDLAPAKRAERILVLAVRAPRDWDAYGQVGCPAELLRDSSGAMRALLDNLAAAKRAGRILVLAVSEFDRPVRENDSEDTDHGSVTLVFLAGPGVIPTTEMPRLARASR
jgi:uncharacterized protein (DUF1501 family)